jgi:hypothetical protein
MVLNSKEVEWYINMVIKYRLPVYWLFNFLYDYESLSEYNGFLVEC